MSRRLSSHLVGAGVPSNGAAPKGRVIVLMSTTNEADVRRVQLPVLVCRKVSNKQPPAPDNAIWDSQVLSRQHAEFLEQGDDVVLRDLNSSNGTYLNGRRVGSETVVIRTGDAVDFGIDVNEDAEGDVPALQQRVSVIVNIAPVDQLADIDIGSSASAPPAVPLGPAASGMVADTLAKLTTTLQGEMEHGKTLDTVLQLMEAISAYKHSYILVARELQVKDARIAELTALRPSDAAEQQQNKTLLDELALVRTQLAQLREQHDAKVNEYDEQTRATIKLQKAMAAERSSRATEVAELNKTITGLETACQTLRDRASSLEQTCKALRDEAAAAAAVPAVVTPPTEEIASRDQKIRELEEAIGRLRGSHGDDLKQAAKAAEVRLQQELARATEASQLELTRLRDEYESRERTAAAQYEAQVRSLQSQLQRAQQPSSSPAPSTPAPARPILDRLLDIISFGFFSSSDAPPSDAAASSSSSSSNTTALPPSSLA